MIVGLAGRWDVGLAWIPSITMDLIYGLFSEYITPNGFLSLCLSVLFCLSVCLSVFTRQSESIL